MADTAGVTVASTMHGRKESLQRHAEPGCARLFFRTACMPASWQMDMISALLILSGRPT